MKRIPIRQIRSAFMEEVSTERFNIRRVEDMVGNKDLVHELHRHNFYFILAIIAGNGTHEIDFTSYPIKSNSVFFIKPGQVHQLELKVGCSGYLLEFNTEFYHPTNNAALQRLQKTSNRNLYQFDRNTFQKLSQILDNTFSEYTAKQEAYQECIKAKLDILMIKLFRQVRSLQATPKSTNLYAQDRLEEFFELLETHVTAHKQVSYYTNLMNLSSFQLNEITKSTVGKTSSELINDHIILEAKRHLLASPNQVKEIAYHLGYEDVSYFIRFFKKHTGFTPEVYRTNHG